MSRTRLRRVVLGGALAPIAAYLLLVLTVRPSNDREWNADQARAPIARFAGDSVIIDDVRNAHYRSVDDFDVRWERRAYDLRELETVWFMVEPFSDWRGPAHTLLSFGFADGRYVGISVEIRKERGEAFSPLRGLLRQYELMYVVADEHDLIGLRANHRRDSVYLYPVRASREHARALFESMLTRANALAERPEFYNTLTSTCTTNIVEHVNAIATRPVRWSHRILLPGYSDELAYDLGLIETDLPREQIRRRFLINDLAARHANSPAFSRGIRGLSDDALPPDAD